MSLAKPDAIFMHCLPADRGYEVDGRRDRRTAERHLGRGGEPPARPEGAARLAARAQRGLTPPDTQDHKLELIIEGEPWLNALSSPIRRTRHLGRHRLAEGCDRQGGRRPRGRRRPGRRGHGGHPPARARLRCRRGGRRRREGRVRQRLPDAGPQGERALPEALSAGLGAEPPGHRQAPRPATAKALGADSVAHGCTGKGNDQVRFEAAVAALAPSSPSIAPVRDLALTRDKAIVYAERAQPADRAVEEEPVLDRPERLGPRGRDRLPRRPVERADRGPLRRTPQDPACRGDADEVVDHASREGIPVGDRRHAGHPARRPSSSMNALAGEHGVGRIDIVEDRLVGIKSREVYEAPAGDRPDRRARRAREPDRRARRRPLQARRRGRVGRAGLRRPLVLRPEAQPRRVHRRHPAVT